MKTLRYIITTVLTPLVFTTAITCPSFTHAAVIAQYHFDESGGTTAFDSIGSVNGTLSGGAAFVSGGISNNAISLTMATNSLVNMGNNFGLTSGDFSIVLWVNTTATANDTIALGKHEAFTENGYLFPINPTGGGGLPNKATFVASQFVSQSPTSTTTVNDAVWHQIVGVHVAGGNNSIYVDGSPAEASTASATLVANSAPFLIGGVNVSGTPTARYTGLLDEVQIYDQALNDSQITFLFQNPAQVVPEPGTLSLLGLGLLGWTAFRRRNRNA